MIKEKDLAKLKKELEEQEKDLLEKIKKLETPADYGHESEGNEDLSEEADETEEDEANMGIAEVFKKELEDVREELNRIKKGAYKK
jgi:RNA polymerase-binding transcription factor DksA